MKNIRIPALCGVLLTALFLVACDWDWKGVPGDNNIFAYDLRGTWVSNDTSVYSGTLKIGSNRITISGYSESQTPMFGNDDRRPFKNFTKGTSLKGYSEEGKDHENNSFEGHIFIEDGGLLQKGIPYTYWENSLSDYTRRQFLRFSFGGRQEVLVKTALE